MLDGRLFEWTFSLGTLWLAVELFIWPSSLAEGAFHHLADFMDPFTVSAYAFIVSFIGIGALIANGRSLITGPMIRSVCAIARAFLWSQFGYALYLDSTYCNRPSAGLGFWVLFTCAELYTAYRAMTDVQGNL